jgi:pimeloyl-ACP methyl ester carboxylesterase
MKTAYPETVPTYSWGDPSRARILFLHANSFAAGMYQPFMEGLLDDYHVLAPELPGHGQSQWPGVIKGWPSLADYYLQQMDNQGLTDPVIAMGHSIGGIISLIMAVKQPQRFSKIVLLDPVLLPGKILTLIAIMRALGQRKRFPLARKAYRRRTHYPDRESALERYRHKRVFARWQPRFLRGYVDHCLRTLPDGSLELACSPELEASIYETLPVNVWSFVRKLRIPTLIVVGEHSDTVAPAGVRRLSRINSNLIVKTTPGGHLFPFEEPEAALKIIREYLK